LAEWQYPQATLLQYVDDLLLCGQNEPVVSQATESLLNFLADKGYKISKEQAQLCQSRVTYLGLVLEKEMRSLEDRIRPILTFPQLKTLKQSRAFLGVTGCCRICILGYADIDRPLYQILKEAQKETQPFLEWDNESENTFHQFKKGSYDSSHLGSPSTIQVSIICL
jgi:hypothetical protein